uniref:Uncharacterized protein n=1 Tax=Brassica campestris TaxID=3711 RepID=A0A3P6AFK0_BRACM|nr:unnamed protein product [Brassica rapa]
MRSKTGTMARHSWRATCVHSSFANLVMSASVATVKIVALNATLPTNPTKVNLTRPLISGDEDEENNGPVDSDGELDIKNRKDASSIHQNFAYGSENGDYNSKQQRRQNGRAFSSTGSVLGKTIDNGSNFLSGRHRRRLEGYEHDKSSLMSQKNFEKRFGMSPVFIAWTLMEKRGLPEATNKSSLIKEAIYVISCG